MEKNMITINKKVTERVKTIEISGDIIVPDIKPDIVNIISTNGNAYIYKEEISKSRIRVDGNIDAYVIYLSENGETRSIQTTLNFIENIDDDNIFDNIFAKEKVILKNIETKILNERKITVKANIEIKCEFFENTQIEVFNKFDEIKDIEKLEESMKVKSIIGMNKVKSAIKENINIDDTCDASEILKTDIQLSNYESKISYNKVLAKADANVRIMFLTEDGFIKCAEETFPIMSFIDIENVSENNMCNVDYMIRNMLFKINSKEMHSINCQIDFEVNCEAYESKDINIIQDMYGTNKDIQFSKKEVEVQLDVPTVVDSIKLDEKILVENINSIYDVDCKVDVLNSTAVGNTVNYEGEVELNIYYETDNKSVLNVKDAKIPFITKVSAECKNVDIRIVKKQFGLNNEDVSCTVELEVVQTSMNLKKINLIENVEQKDLQESSEYVMSVYFVKSGDTIWNIAKRFKVSMDNIVKTNTLENPDKINIGDKLYIVK